MIAQATALLINAVMLVGLVAGIWGLAVAHPRKRLMHGLVLSVALNLGGLVHDVVDARQTAYTQAARLAPRPASVRRQGLRYVVAWKDQEKPFEWPYGPRTVDVVIRAFVGSPIGGILLYWLGTTVDHYRGQHRRKRGFEVLPPAGRSTDVPPPSAGQ